MRNDTSVRALSGFKVHIHVWLSMVKHACVADVKKKVGAKLFQIEVCEFLNAIRISKTHLLRYAQLEKMQPSSI